MRLSFQLAISSASFASAVLDGQLADTRHVTKYGVQSRCLCQPTRVSDWSPAGDYYCSDSQSACAADEYVVEIYMSTAGGFFGDCGPASDSTKCHIEKTWYDVVCGKCPGGYIPSYIDTRNCGWQGESCVACTGPNEVLAGTPHDISKSGSDPDPLTCVPGCGGSSPMSKRGCPVKKCPTLTAVSDPYLIGPQVIVSTAFEADVHHLVSCARAMGAGLKPNLAALYAVSTSRCGKSPSSGLSPAKGTSLHQVGCAIDVNLNLPSGRFCDRNCMGKAYCAFNANLPTSKSAGPKIKGGSATDPDNILINSFFKCAGKTGLAVGAAFTTVGDWNHFGREVLEKKANGLPDRQPALDAYRPQLKKFCLKDCEGIVKGQVPPEMCGCAGFS